jgi:hypothetical protein
MQTIVASTCISQHAASQFRQLFLCEPSFYSLFLNIK